MELNNFFNHVVDGYLFHDLKNMNEVKQKKGEPAGGIGYPMLATTASGIELLGGVLQQYEKYKDDAHSSYGYFQHYWNEYLVPNYETYRGKELIFWKLVRHGVAHTYITKLGITVTKRRPSKHLLPTPAGLNIDCSTFYKHFLNSYTKTVKKQLKNDVFAAVVQANINRLFELSDSSAEKFHEVIFSRNTDFEPLSATIKGAPAASSVTAIPPEIIASMREQALKSTIAASGASLARPIENLNKTVKPPID